MQISKWLKNLFLLLKRWHEYFLLILLLYLFEIRRVRNNSFCFLVHFFNLFLSFLLKVFHLFFNFFLSLCFLFSFFLFLLFDSFFSLLESFFLLFLFLYLLFLSLFSKLMSFSSNMIHELIMTFFNFELFFNQFLLLFKVICFFFWFKVKWIIFQQEFFFCNSNFLSKNVKSICIFKEILMLGDKS